jgi:uncharacterized protein (TIGR03083 family)
MPRATNKKQLLEDMQKERAALTDLLADLSASQMTQPGVLGEWSVKDVLGHLIEWEQMVLSWYAAGVKGKTPAVPAEGFKWSELPALNQKIYEKHRDRPLADILKRFDASYRKTTKLVEGLSDKDLFSWGRYAWAGNNALAAYIIGSSSSHYRWARTGIRKGLSIKSL